MGRTFKDHGKNRRYSENDYSEDFANDKANKQNAKRFRKDRSSKRSVKDDNDSEE